MQLNYFIYPGLKVYCMRDFLKAKQNTDESKVERVISVVEKHTSITTEELKSKSRKREIVEARQIAMAIIRNITSKTVVAIGEIFGNRHYTTVIYARDTVLDLIETDPRFKKLYTQILKEIE